MIILKAEDIQLEILKNIGRIPKKDVWQYLVNSGYIDDLQKGFLDIQDLVQIYLDLAEVPQHLYHVVSVRRGIGLRRIRLEILSKLLAQDVERMPEVVDFRQRVLPEGLITPSEVEEWISMILDREGEPTTYLKVPLPDGHELVWDGLRVYPDPPLVWSRVGLSVSTPAAGWSRDFLHYQLKDGISRSSIPVRQGGELDSLRILAEVISDRYLWQKTHATLFVLTGIFPFTASLRGDLLISSRQPISSRITMEIDPTLTPEEVVQEYKRLRDRFIKNRYRSMSEKHLRLAEFYGGNKDKSWSVMMLEWNKVQKKKTWKYDQSPNFARDCKRAWDRLVGEDLFAG